MKIYKTSGIAAMRQAIKFVDYRDRLSESLSLEWLKGHLENIKRLNPMHVNSVWLVPYVDKGCPFDDVRCLAFGAYNADCCLRIPALASWTEYGNESYSQDLFGGHGFSSEQLKDLTSQIESCSVEQFPYCSADKPLSNRRSVLEAELDRVLAKPELGFKQLKRAEYLTACLMLDVESTYQEDL